MKPDTTGLLTIEAKRFYRFLDVGTQFVPRIALREDALGEALRAKSTIGFLGYQCTPAMPLEIPLPGFVGSAFPVISELR
jgi:hypothetical protein